MHNQNSPPTDDFLTLEEVAKLMRISLTVAYELARADKLPIRTIRVGCQYRFSRHAYDALLTRQHDERSESAA